MNNNNQPNARGSNRKRRARGDPSGAAPPVAKAQKQGKASRPSRQNRKRAARRGRAASRRGEGGGDALTGRGSTQNRSGYGNKASMPIWESEYVAEITPTAQPAFSLQQFPVNPGQVLLFPWLSRIAQNFEKYEFEFLDFVYKREVSEFATNGVTGKVIMSFDADATDAAPTSKQQMEDTDPHADCMPCENMRLSVPQDILRKFNDAHFVRPGTQPANTDLKTYDIGTLYVACQGTAANTAVGELHVEYALRLRVPILEPVTGQSGVLTMAAATIASPFLAGVGAGGIGLSGVLTTLTMTNLVAGAEYAVVYGGATGAGGDTTDTFSAMVGGTIKSVLSKDVGTITFGITFTATATVATVTLTVNGAPGAATLIVAQIPVTAV